MKPRFKDFYPVIPIDSKCIQIGDEPNNAFEIEDEDGILMKVLPLLNGKRNLNQILSLTEELALNLTDLEELIESLNEIGLIDDGSSNDILNEWELIRYKNNLNFFNIFSNLEKPKVSYQKKIIDSKVLVIGMGGLGSNILMQLSGLGVGNIKFLDYDNVELKNLNRQVLYSEKYIGHEKTKVGLKRLREFNTSINYGAINRKITSSQDLSDIITADLDFVFCAADYPPLLINLWVNEVCIKNSIPFISGGVGLASGSFYSILPSITPCYDCYYSYIKNEHKQVLDAYQLIGTDYNSAILPNISLLASMIVTEFMRIHLKIAEPISGGKKTIINFITSEITFEKEWKQNHQCLICSNLSLNSPSTV